MVQGKKGYEAEGQGVTTLTEGKLNEQNNKRDIQKKRGPTCSTNKARYSFKSVILVLALRSAVATTNAAGAKEKKRI